MTTDLRVNGSGAKPAPFLEIVTRHMPGRLPFLERNQESLAAQTSRDWKQTLLVDDVGQGLAWANGQLQHVRPRGEYVLILDDDDLLTDPKAIARLKAATADKPDLVVFKADHAGLGILPAGKAWGSRPRLGQIGSCDFITRRDVWQKHIAAFARPSCGDYHFLMSVWNDEPRVVWLDAILAGVQRISHGRPA